ncbi:MAG: SpoIIE family protein phosphatase [Phycisphaerae bacterium]
MDPQEAGDRPAPTILIVDDEEAIRTLLCHALQMLDSYRLLEAADGQEAQKVLRSNEVDLVITDLAMPELDGLALMQWAHEQCPGPVWLILSGQGTFKDAVRAVHLGAFDFVTKPIVSMDSFLVTVRNALQQKQLVRERERLLRDIEERNVRLAQQVTQLKQACGLLRKQAKVIHEDMRRAELIQRALLPRQVPEIEELSLETIYRPSQNVGGDLYDIVRLGEHHVVVYVADAAGHGVAAAMLAVLFKHRIPLTCGQPPAPTDPSVVLESVNRCLVDECRGPGLFVTAAYCLLNTETGELRFASAGHPAPLLVHGDGEVIRLEHTGPALGLSRSASFDQREVEMRPDDRLLLYTDGLVESSTGDSPMDLRELAGVLSDRSRRGMDVLHAVMEASRSHRGDVQEDDITMVLLATTGEPSAIDNGEPVAESRSKRPIPRPRANSALLMGSDDDGTFVSLIGRANWTSCPAFHDVCLAEIRLQHPLTLDLTVCSYLDSTFLGTIQELVERADRQDVSIRLQGVRSEVRHLFEELGMEGVLSHLQPDSRPLPDQMEPLAVPEPSGEELLDSELRILNAHEALASLSEENRREFGTLIDRLRQELSEAQP